MAAQRKSVRKGIAAGRLFPYLSERCCLQRIVIMYERFADGRRS